MILLAIGNGTVSKHLAARTGVAAATISHHTTVLREAGLITTERTANTVVHALTPRGAHLIGQNEAMDDASPSETNAAGHAFTAASEVHR